MSQQINLLVRKKSGSDFSWAALAILGLVLVAMLGLWVVRLGELNRAQAAEAATAQQLQATNARLQALVQRSGTNLTAEIDALKIRAEVAQKTLDRVGELGSQQGYANYFSRLASVNEEGLWLTNVAVNNGGKIISLNGRALRQESVMHYAERLNALFADVGVKFTALEITPESAGSAGNSGAQLNAVAFRLY